MRQGEVFRGSEKKEKWWQKRDDDEEAGFAYFRFQGGVEGQVFEEDEKESEAESGV